MAELSGKTILITGGSRGIGQAIGLRCASAGANIVIVAKEDLSQHSGASIYSVADQMIEAGGQALVIDCDVRDEAAIQAAVGKAVSEFGLINVLINNVSAFCFTDTMNTTPDNLDLLFSVNARATFLMTKACIPSLRKSYNPHVINISPPLDMNPKWFANHLAFSLSKYGMSLCTLGMAAEFKEAGIAVNSLWPLTTIATTTIQDHFVPQVFAGSRWPSIMADAAYELMQRSAEDCTGNFFIDETLLREVGVTNFSHYAVDPGVPLMQDLFIPDKYLEENRKGTPLVKNMFMQHK